MYLGRIPYRYAALNVDRFSLDPTATMVNRKRSKSRNRKETASCEDIIRTKGAAEDVEPKLQALPKSAPKERTAHASPQVNSLRAVMRCVRWDGMLC